MIVIRSPRLVTTAMVVSAVAVTAAFAQQPPPPTTPVARIVAEPATLALRVGDTAVVKVTAYDAGGNVIPNAQFRMTGPRGAVRVANTDRKSVV